MNIPSLKRKALGWMALGENSSDGSPGGTGLGGISGGSEGGRTGGGTGGWSAGDPEGPMGPPSPPAEDSPMSPAEAAAQRKEMERGSNAVGSVNEDGSLRGPATRAENNVARGLPSDYHADDRSLWGQIKDGAFDFGVRGWGTTAQDVRDQEAEHPNLLDTRMDKLTGVMNGVGQTVMNAVPGMGYMKAIANTVNKVEGGMSVADAITGTVKDYASGIVASKINGAVGAAVPGLSQVNKGISLANMAGAGIPSINPGGIVSNAVFGKPSTPNATVNGNALTSPDGTNVSGLASSGWSSSGNHGNLAPVMTVKDQTPTATKAPAFSPRHFNTDLEYKGN